jgi:phosphoribosylformimino-5-aminoimidazole carboxamide ribotide isomerase
LRIVLRSATLRRMAFVVVPSIDLRGGSVVRLKQGDYGQQINYAVDPIATARSFKESGATWMHVVDLDGAKEGRPAQTDLIRRIISESGLLVQVGGGIRERGHVEDLLAAGASRVVVGTKALEAWDWFRELAHDASMRDRLTLALDAKDGVVATRGWTASSGRNAVDVAHEVSDWPLAAILYTDVAKDGMLQGPNLHHTRLLAQAGRVPVIASGGVGNIQHVRDLLGVPVWGAIIGRSLYEGTLDLRDALRVAAGPPPA